MDVRLGWSPADNLEISIVGRNLLDSAHQEFVPAFVDTLPSQVERSVYGKITWRF